MPNDKDKTVASGIYRDMDAHKRALVADHVDESLMKDIRKKVKTSVLKVGNDIVKNICMFLTLLLRAFRCNTLRQMSKRWKNI